VAQNDNENELDAKLREAVAQAKSRTKKDLVVENRELVTFAQELLNSYQRFASSADSFVDPALIRRARELGLDVDD
jgi:hypothetical protein